uniref:Zgc:163098 n=1 Tax=Gadus morhua TaxID=8049 RepID=A0A8C5D6R4_GADMO
MAERKGKPASAIKSLSKREQEELKKKEQEKAAEVFEEFLASFEGSTKSGVKTFVRGGIVNVTKGEDPGIPGSRFTLNGCLFDWQIFKKKMNEEMLCKEFGKYGPLASVKIMWPRTDEERCRTTNRAFVAYMTRRDAERALASLDGKTVMGFEMKLGWGKPARIPPQPLYTPTGMRLAPPPPSGLPFNAQPRDRLRNDFTKPLGRSKSEFDKTLSEAVVKVVIPTERILLVLIHRMVEFVVREGPMFEAIIMSKEKNNPDFRFLFDNKSQDHVYYRWRLFCILQGESLSEWRTREFRMFQGGSIWRPPALNAYSSRDTARAGYDPGTPQEEEEEEGKKGQLKAEHRRRLEGLLRELGPRRGEVAEAMAFCVERAEAAEEVVLLISESLSMLHTPLQKKISRLYLVSDILYNSCAKVAGASYFRKYFESKLLQIFGDLHAAYKNIQGRLQAEQFKQKVMGCFRAWEDWAIYPEAYLLHLQNVFLGFTKAAEETGSPPDLDGAPLEGPLLDGEVLDELDGAPLVWDPLDGVPVDDIDGVPLGVVPATAAAAMDDIDGMPRRYPLPGINAIRAFVKQCMLPGRPTINSSLFLPGCRSSRLEKGGHSESESSDGSSPSKYDSADFENSLRTFQMSEGKRKRLREIEVKVMRVQDELESGQRSRRSGMSLQQQVGHYRRKLLQKVRGRSPRRAKLSRSPSADRRARRSKSRSPHRSHKKSKKSKR